MPRSFKAKDFIQRIEKHFDPQRRRLETAILLTKLFRVKKISSYIAGGSAVEFYTDGEFMTGDIDIAVSNREEAIAIIEELGFQKSGRVWLHPTLGVVVDILREKRTPIGKFIKFKAGDTVLNLWPPEDLIINRLVITKWWKEQGAVEQAKALIKLFKEKLDIDNLKKEAQAQHVNDILEELLE